MFIEKYLQNPKHLEFQIMGDKHGNVVHLGERECSLQRKHQKILEEAPSASVTPAMRKEMGDMAVRFAKSIGYYSAGTIEFIMDEDGSYYFMEMNTRIQVEHPVTEMITGIDLVQWMLRIANGEPLTLRQDEIVLKGSACEMRINAEDPERNFFPCPGVVKTLVWPQGAGVRIDSHLFAGYCIPPYYDSLLAKLVIYGANRAQTLSRASAALEEMQLTGIKTTQFLHQWLLADTRLRAGEFSTTSLECWLTERATTNTAVKQEA